MPSDMETPGAIPVPINHNKLKLTHVKLEGTGELCDGIAFAQ